MFARHRFHVTRSVDKSSPRPGGGRGDSAHHTSPHDVRVADERLRRRASRRARRAAPRPPRRRAHHRRERPRRRSRALDCRPRDPPLGARRLGRGHRVDARARVDTARVRDRVPEGAEEARRGRGGLPRDARVRLPRRAARGREVLRPAEGPRRRAGGGQDGGAPLHLPLPRPDRGVVARGAHAGRQPHDRRAAGAQVREAARRLRQAARAQDGGGHRRRAAHRSRTQRAVRGEHRIRRPGGPRRDQAAGRHRVHRGRGRPGERPHRRDRRAARGRRGDGRQPGGAPQSGRAGRGAGQTDAHARSHRGGAQEARDGRRGGGGGCSRERARPSPRPWCTSRRRSEACASGGGGTSSCPRT